MKRAAVFLLLAGAPSALAAANFEKTIPIPRTSAAKFNWSSGGCAVVSVRLQNYPSGEDVSKARTKDPDDKSWVWWNFQVENRGNVKCRVHLWVDVYGKSGGIAKSSDRSDTIDAGKLDDNIRLSTRMRTLDIVDSPKAKIRAEITPK